MGTRNLTMVIKDGKTKIAQYGQWDGYPSGQGITVLRFLKRMNRRKFEDQLDKCYFATSRTPEENLTMKYNSRDHGGGILNIVYDSTDDRMLLVNKSKFIIDGLFCEWAYIIDLDKNVLQVYEGFYKERLTTKDRFYRLQQVVEREEREHIERLIAEGKTPYERDTIYRCKLNFEFNLDDLPTESEFLGILEPVESEE